VEHETGLSSVWWRLPDVDVADGRADAGDVAGGHAGGRMRRDMLLRSVLGPVWLEINHLLISQVT